MKYMRTLICSLLVIVCICGTNTALAEDGDLTFSPETCIFSISNERFVRKASELASPDECGKDEYVTLRINAKNTSGKSVALQAPYISIDGGEKLRWKDSTIDAGKTASFHVYYTNARKLTPGLHTAAFYAADTLLYSCRFNIGRSWGLTFPTEAECAARSLVSSDLEQRSPYLASWLDIDHGTRYDAYCVDIKADYLPNGTYCSGFNGYLDLSSLEEQYETVSVSQGGISCYAGLQNRKESEGTASILSFWDIYCTDKAGKTTTIRPKQIAASGMSDDDSFSNEGTGAHSIIPYEWKAGRWYRMLLQCGTNEKTGNTTVEQWFQDLATGKWTHICTYDTGIPDSCFIAPAAFFLENYLTKYAGEVRTMEVANIRIRTVSDGQWKDVVHTGSVTKSFGTGSWQAGADDNSFYMIITGVPNKWDTPEKTESLSISNLESGDPREMPVKNPTEPAKKPIGFQDVPSNAYYAAPVSWAVEKDITAGTSKTAFSPNLDCTTAQILTFLWRAKGKPKPAGAVNGSQYYASAAQWAKEQGLTDGVLAPDAPCTRSMAVNYIWKAVGSPSVGKADFTDVPAGADYAQAVAWAVEQGVTTGASANTFSPDTVCTRAQIVTFLYRAFAK